jgi:hypothetical protein
MLQIHLWINCKKRLLFLKVVNVVLINNHTLETHDRGWRDDAGLKAANQLVARPHEMTKGWSRVTPISISPLDEGKSSCLVDEDQLMVSSDLRWFLPP